VVPGSSGMAWVAALLAVIVLPALLAVGPSRAAPATPECANVTQPGIITGTTPILFVHGINSDPTTWTEGTVSGTSLAPLNYIESALGTQVTGYTFDWSQDSGFRAGSKLSWVTGPPAPGPGQLLAQAVECVAAKAGNKVIIVAHSMGGLLTEYASSVDSVSSDIAAVYTLGTPYQGSWLDSAANDQLGWLSQAIGAYCSFGGSLYSFGAAGQGAKQHVKPAGGIEALCHIAGERDDPGMKGMRADTGTAEGWQALSWSSAGFPVFPLAASIQVTNWQPLPLFGPQVTFADFGDFVVGTSSELDGGTTPPVTCTVPLTGAVVLPTLLSAVTASSCFHTNEPDNKTLLDTIISSITQNSLVAQPSQTQPAQQPPTQQPPTQQPPTQQSPTQQPPTQLPPTQQPPTQQSPTQQGPAPFSIAGSSPASGPASGGTLIVIRGTGFSSVTTVVMNSDEPPLGIGDPNYDLQNLHPSFTIVSDSEIDVTTLAGAAGFTYQIDFVTPTASYFANSFPGIPFFTYE
jgi:hypothetical protein